MQMCAVPAGQFLVGDDRRPAGTGAYEISETPVTNVQFVPFVRHGYGGRSAWSPEGREWRERCGIVKPRFFDDPEWQAYLAPDQPVVGVSWYEADAFARWLGMRLPTEAEWERAARGDDGRTYPWGDDWDPAMAAHRGGKRHTLPVRSIAGNRSPWGLYDCAGNVWEWCSDWYDASRTLRAARGGAWNAHPPQLRCANRNAWPPDARFSNLGFRVAR
ncbi:MAG TPA: SUMF1/EgtB/PvdO family nonheme iron enzyme [Myxococcales bacterium]|nr:SUMF1/EgtB/PvdO family nonheme iron enzyme [Myxococcales bacterium]